MAVLLGNLCRHSEEAWLNQVTIKYVLPPVPTPVPHPTSQHALRWGTVYGIYIIDKLINTHEFILVVY